MNPMHDLIRLSQQYGKIPDQIPAHYVKWAIYQHKLNRVEAIKNPSWYEEPPEDPPEDLEPDDADYSDWLYEQRKEKELEAKLLNWHPPEWLPYNRKL